jgi:hypothetical protein
MGVFLTFRAAWIIQSSQERLAPRIRTSGLLVTRVSKRTDEGACLSYGYRSHPDASYVDPSIFVRTGKGRTL